MDPPPPQACGAQGCHYNTPIGVPTWEAVVGLMQAHTQQAYPLPPPAAAPVAAGGAGQGGGAAAGKLDKRPRPQSNTDMSEHEFKFFENEWLLYKRATGVAGQTLVDELYSTMSPELRKLAYDQGDITNIVTEAAMLERIRSLAVSVLHAAVHTVALHEAVQLPEESVKTFAARVRGIAANCELEKKCVCDLKVNYTEETVYHVVLAGLKDRDLQSRCTAQALLKQITDINSLVAYCTAEESSKLGAAGNVAGIRKSAYKQQKSARQVTGTVGCNCCGEKHTGLSKEIKEKECKAFKMVCFTCREKGHLARYCKKGKKSGKVDEIAKEESGGNVTAENSAMEFTFFTIEVATQNRFEVLDEIGEVSEVRNKRVAGPGRNSGWRSHPVARRWSRKPKATVQPPSAPDRAELRSIETPQRQRPIQVPVCHMEYDYDRGWQQSAIKPSPTLPVELSLCHRAYQDLQIPPPSTKKPGQVPRSTVRRSVADTGAQLNVMDVQTLKDMGIDEKTLAPCTVKLRGATRGSEIDVLGVVFVEVRAPGPPATRARLPQQFYVASNVTQTYLSFRCLQDLGVVSEMFPRAGEAWPRISGILDGNAAGKCDYDGVSMCSCPDRELPPRTPAELPCAPTEANIPKLEEYIRNRYKASAFNNCCRQKIPTLQGSPPMTLNVSEGIKPVACHKPAAVPLHWQEAVREGLERDVRLGVLERVPLNTPVRWQSRMVCTAKHDGTPRRTVDYNAVNANCPRQTHHTPSPWQLASAVPGGTYKTVVDNWNGYHSMGLATEKDKDLTTFITPWGRFRYLVAPQGLRCSGDAFTDRMDRLYDGFERMVRCVDDALIYDHTVEEQFHRTCAALDQGGNNGALFHPGKFQFCKKEVDFVGLVVGDTGVRPPQEFFESIRGFPTPQNITDVRAWFGMIAQVSFAFSELPVMAPFRHLLSTKTPFAWSAELEAAFRASKEEIISACVTGVRNFDSKLPTCLATDWSKLGIGY